MNQLLGAIESISAVETYGSVVAAQGLLAEIGGPLHAMSLGSHLVIEATPTPIDCEVIAFRADRALAMPFGRLDGVRKGARVRVGALEQTIRPAREWLGRIVNAFGQPIDGKGGLALGVDRVSLRAPPVAAHERDRVGAPLDLGVRALNAFATCCRGQRMGIFAGSGVGKSVLLSMLARNAAAGITIIGLVGERGREVREFIEDHLGPSGLARSIVVVATSDESALMRRQAAYMTLALAEYFRDAGEDVLCFIDSVTRFAQAQREIGLAAGESPTSRGYTPTVFTELPRLLERAGPGRRGSGTITGLFTVLVEGDDHNEPIADAVRGTLDGHIVMERAIAERGRYPAINILKTVSRTMPAATEPRYRETVAAARRVMATYADMEDLIRLGAYRRGSSPEVDEAIRLNPALEAFLSQTPDETSNLSDSYRMLAEIVGVGPGQRGRE